MRLLLVRHGQTSSNVAGALDTATPGADLTELGREQADAIVPAFAGERVDAIYTSTLVRTQQTAAPLAADRGLEPTVRAGLREVGAGDVEMRTDEDAMRIYFLTLLSWAGGDLEVGMPGAETGHEALGRFDAVVDEIWAEAEASGRTDQTVAVFSHGAILRLWACLRCANLAPDYLGDRHLSNTGVIVVEGSPGAWTALSWEDDAIGGDALTDLAHDGPAAG
ncbi:histidine phosphatase family protein [Arsenicicoccus piscis]|uniref:Isomerase n=1 Tax=Arsenicicoccus piscis TaxID=673954 RepID=A0ABQ6HT37_9MICO|nr:histidine phosphatase family protein [Arsenicicoccus piscis]MCH8626372.1 histidine phosphatase family protein [Arsenicicoccus piscis]GMA20988.1 isomerase [Arsenicicoccus piscis]